MRLSKRRKEIIMEHLNLPRLTKDEIRSKMRKIRTLNRSDFSLLPRIKHDNPKKNPSDRRPRPTFKKGQYVYKHLSSSKYNP